MSTIVTRSGKGSPLTHTEVDNNFTNLNTDKYQEGSAIGAVTPAAGTFTTLTATGQTSLGGVAGSEAFRAVTVASSVDYVSAYGSSSANVSLRAEGSDPNINIALTSKGASTSASNIRFYTNNMAQEQMRVAHTASAVNYVQVTGAATGGNPSFTATGSDSNVSANFVTKGAGYLAFLTNTTAVQFQVSHTGSSVNYLTASGAAATFAPRLYAQGSDTNISQVFQSKGTGAIDLAAGSSGVNISNGGTVTAITRTATGSGYTSVPTIAITAPTTSGGVQAVLSPRMSNNSAVTITNGGSGYSVNDVLTVVGGSGAAIQITVSSVSAGVVTAAAITNVGFYITLPSNPVSVTGGTGSGATFTLGAYYFGGAAIDNAGSGYVEQPTVSFSGGGGSGAAAYATVGSGTTVKSIGSTMSLYTPAGENFRVRDPGSTVTDFPFAIGSNFGRPVLGATTSSGSGNASLALTAWGSGGILQFMTNNTAQEQMRVAHTASAVNYVQVTGAATGNRPVISAQGSDTNIGILFAAKGTTLPTVFLGSGGSTNQFVVSNNGAGTNYLQTSSAATTVAPVLSSQGSDTNIDLALTPKGTGAVVANGPLTATGQTSLGGAVGSESVIVPTSLSSGGTVLYLHSGTATGTVGGRVYSGGSASGSSLLLASKGTSGAIKFFTNESSYSSTWSNRQLEVSHTASAVNYVQVTGAATGNAPALSAQGSDTSMNFTIAAKGSGSVSLPVNRANYLTLAGTASTGGSTSISAVGSDTDIDLSLTPKGTGNVKFGTYTANMALTVQGYIEIKDSGGTVRKLAVIA